MNKNKKLTRIKNFFLDIFFPKFCFGCKKEGEYLCEDCRATLEILESQYPKCQSKKLNGLYFALLYRNPLIKELIKKFKYEPFVKELGDTLASLILDHFLLIGKNPQKDFAGFLIVPVPLDKSRKKWRGFNQAEEIGKNLAQYLNISLEIDTLIKIKKTALQVNLNRKERQENVKEAFKVKNTQAVKEKKILLVDDVYTTGSTMEECAKVLKKAGAKEVWGAVIARARPGEDRFEKI